SPPTVLGQRPDHHRSQSRRPACPVARLQGPTPRGPPARRRRRSARPVGLRPGLPGEPVVSTKQAVSRPQSDLAYLCRALKAPTLAAAVDRLAERARAEGWRHEEFLCACLEREVA